MPISYKSATFKCKHHHQCKKHPLETAEIPIRNLGRFRPKHRNFLTENAVIQKLQNDASFEDIMQRIHIVVKVVETIHVVLVGYAAPVGGDGLVMGNAVEVEILLQSAELLV